MDVTIVLRGLLIGFAIAAPVGPIGVLCIRRTLAAGQLVGLASGLGAATADAFYGAVAGFGLAFISSFLLSQQLALRLIGGAFLLCLGVRTFLAHPAGQAAAAQGRGILGAYLSTLLLTLTNPTTILSCVAIFAGLGVASATRSYLTAALLVLGVFCGSALWWLALSSGVTLFRQRVSAHGLAWVNRVSGIIIGGFGLAALASLAR